MNVAVELRTASLTKFADATRCEFCGRSEGTFVDFAPPMLCQACADVVITSAGNADAATPSIPAASAALSDPRSPSSPIDGAAARDPHAHSQSVASISEVPLAGSPAPAAAVAAVSVAAGAHDMPEIPSFLRREVAA